MTETITEPRTGSTDPHPDSLLTSSYRTLITLWKWLRRKALALRADLLDRLQIALLGGLALGAATIMLACAGYLLLAAGVEILDLWVPRWAALLIEGCALLLLAAGAAGMGLWLLARARRRRGTAASRRVPG
ncbi:hypothetical protein GV791_12620 [Nocardia cyriacigeorgica]|uniref:Phage holin family protein n=1 Tax=Nocardia cyriacigeorgica TaxID=135487 RepID=A0A6P1CLC5_9NOCA|nr:hypothetical protein [Nocardia cyriacigeorgica]NEW33399.1 hypothetical protein [Nocardia cyriacigeorgica]